MIPQHIKIIGEKKKIHSWERYLVEIDKQPIYLPGNDFRYILSLSLLWQYDKYKCLPDYYLDGITTTAKYLYRMKQNIKKQIHKDYECFIKNSNGAGYRIEANEIEIHKQALEFNDGRVETLVSDLKELFHDKQFTIASI